MMQLQGQKEEKAGDSCARELQLEEQFAEACSIIDEQVQQRNMSDYLLNRLLWVTKHLLLFTFFLIISETILLI